jgi:ubiquinone biosynthesis protein
VASIFSTVRDIERLRQIAVVLARHGFGEIVERAGLRAVRRGPDDAPASEPPVDAASASAGVGKRLRLVFQDLGPSFVKLGQILSTRPDLLPPDVIAELKLLQDRVPPVPFSELRGALEAELGAPISEVFEQFDEQPLASASVAQVHRATLAVPEAEGGPRHEQVVVKIQRPGIRDTVLRDIELLYILARALERSVPESRVYSPVGLVAEFDRAITDELDFTREADHAERFVRSFMDDPTVRFPRVYRQASARQVLTLEFLDGKKLQAALAAGHSGERLAKRTLDILFKQIFEDGFFHGDPHPGNILILGTPDAPVIGFIDLGLVGRLSAEMRDRTVDLMVAAARQDARGVADALYAIGTPTRRIDRLRYEAEVTVLAEKYLGKPLKEIELSGLVRDLVQGALKFGLEIPPEFMMLGRTLMTVEGVGKELYPDLDVYSESRPFFLRMVWRRYSPERLGPEALRALTRFSGTATQLPDKLDEILDALRSGSLVVRTSDPSLPGATELLGRRVFSGLTVAAFVLAGALLISTRSAEGLGIVLLALAGVWIVAHVARAAFMAHRLNRGR